VRKTAFSIMYQGKLKMGTKKGKEHFLDKTAKKKGMY